MFANETSQKCHEKIVNAISNGNLYVYIDTWISYNIFNNNLLATLNRKEEHR